MSTDKQTRAHARKILLSAAGLVVALAAGVAAVGTIATPPYGLKADSMARWAVWLLVAAAVLGFSGVGLSIVEVLEERREAGLAPREDFLRKIHGLRFQWPVYRKETREALLINARIEARAESETRAREVLEESEARARQAAEQTARMTLELATVRHQLENSEFISRELREVLSYGRTVGSPRVLDTREYGAMRQSLQELRPSVERLDQAASEMWLAMLAMDERVEKDSALAWMLHCFRSFPSRFRENAKGDFLRFVDAADRDPRPYLLATAITYAHWREWTLRLIGLLGHTAADAGAVYDEWVAAEAEFCSELTKKLSTPLMAEVRSSLGSYTTNAGRLKFPNPLPVTVPTGGSLAAANSPDRVT